MLNLRLVHRVKVQVNCFLIRVGLKLIINPVKIATLIFVVVKYALNL